MPPLALDGLNTLALLLCITFCGYVTLILVPYLRHRPGAPGRADAFDWHFIVPCLNEELVIGPTVRALLDVAPKAHVWVVDDASDDATASILDALATELPRVHVLTRRLPQARQGKGPSLNVAWRAISAYVGGDVDRCQVMVGVIDADGHLDAAAPRVLAGDRYFGRADVGAVQVQVRMVNRGRAAAGAPDRPFARLLVTMQDLEFRTVIAAMQNLRRHTASVGMGGNGQFTRLSVLDEIAASAGTPWHGALLEDFELGVHVLLTGARTEYADETWVSQEGLTSVSALLRQRSRWAQGAMQCHRYLPRIMVSPRISTTGALEMAYFLALPWLQVVGTLVYVFATTVMGYYAFTTIGGPAAWWLGGAWGAVPLIAIFGIAPFALWGVVYRGRYAPDLTRRHALALGLANWVYSYAHCVAVWRAFIRVLRGRNDWLKTTRVAGTPPAIAAGAPATTDVSEPTTRMGATASQHHGEGTDG